MEDGGGDAVVVGGRSAGERGLLIEAEKGRAVERVVAAVVVALGAAGLVDGVSAGLLRVELIERDGRGVAMASGECGGAEESGEPESRTRGEGHGDIVASGRTLRSQRIAARAARKRCSKSRAEAGSLVRAVSMARCATGRG